jgi:anaerobic C4-dicarboxylate transporter
MPMVTMLIILQLVIVLAMIFIGAMVSIFGIAWMGSTFFEGN